MSERMDSEVRVLAGISATLQAEYTQPDDAWVGSPFAWIKTRPSRQVGAIGEKLVAGWLAARDFSVSRSKNSDADRIIEEKRVEVKFSTLWTNKPVYRFQQFRDQEYDFVICLGVSPFDAHCWAIDKAEILHRWRVTGEIPSQHAGGVETAWLSVEPGDPPDWISAHGGTLRSGLARVSDLTGFIPPDPNADSL